MMYVERGTQEKSSLSEDEGKSINPISACARYACNTVSSGRDQGVPGMQGSALAFQMQKGDYQPGTTVGIAVDARSPTQAR